MKNAITVLAFLVAGLSGTVSTTAFATSHKEAPDMAKGASTPMTAQQSKMGQCNSDAGDKKGDDRKAFMKTCLSAKKMSQQDKMKACNADPKAKASKGDDRKAFMKDCLSA